MGKAPVSPGRKAPAPRDDLLELMIQMLARGICPIAGRL